MYSLSAEAFIAGTLKERRRCREFVNWLLQQRRGSVTITDLTRRDDVTEVGAGCKASTLGCLQGLGAGHVIENHGKSMRKGGKQVIHRVN